LFKPNQKYEVTLTGIRGFIGLKPTTFDAQFSTAQFPEITNLSVANNQTNVPICDDIKINLSNDVTSLFGLDESISPNVDITLSKIDSKTFNIKFASCLLQGQDYYLTLSNYFLDAKSQQKIYYDKNPFVVKFTTAMPPQISSYSPKGSNILVSTPKFSISFPGAMKTDYKTTNIKVTPAIGGTWRWDDNQTFSYSFSGKLAFGTNYVFEFPDSFYTTAGGYTDPDLKPQFTTIGPVQIASISPQNNSSQVSASSGISVTFDQDVDQNSAQSAFSISPATSGKFSWSGTKMTFSPDNPLQKSTPYGVTITAPVKSINGLPMSNTFVSHFTTEDKVVILNIPVDYQDRALSCEAAATKMALNYKGANVSEDSIMNYVGYDPTVRSGNVWGDPYSAFVGSIDGSQDSTGYGVYWGPIAAAANHFRQASAFSSGTVQKLAQELDAGNPIVIWGTIGNATKDSWQTPAGTTISGWKGEHARTVVGYKGSADNPVAFYLNDPVKGRIIWTTSDLLGNWGAFQNSGVVIY
jgi:uncharacterized protein YvpB